MVAERLGFARDAALTLGQTVAGLSAYAKGVSLGIIEPQPDLVRVRGQQHGEGEQLHVGLLGRAVPAEQTPDGIRAVSQGKPGNPAQVEKYLASKFGSDLEAARASSRPSCSAAASGSMNASGPTCPRGSPVAEPRASWIRQRYEEPHHDVSSPRRIYS